MYFFVIQRICQGPLFEALSRLPRLTSLTLLEFDIETSESSMEDYNGAFRTLPQVTDLTLVKLENFDSLFSSFHYIVTEGPEPVFGFRADQCMQALAERFPNLKSLTIVTREDSAPYMEQVLRTAAASHFPLLKNFVPIIFRTETST